MTEQKEEFILIEYLKDKDLKYTDQRKLILDTFLAMETHFTVEDLYEKIKLKNPSLGFTTVYRTLKLFTDCGLANEIKFEDGITRYEHRYGHEHHDHLVCTKCGKLIEVMEPEIEDLQKKLAQKHGFNILHHRMELYGICKNCAAKK